MTTNLVVADMSRTEKTIGLAVSPSLKSFGIPGRPRLFEVVQKVKEGGAYVDVTGIVKEIDEYERCIVMTDKKKIPIEQVRAIEGDLFKCLEL